MPPRAEGVEIPAFEIPCFLVDSFSGFDATMSCEVQVRHHGLHAVSVDKARVCLQMLPRQSASWCSDALEFEGRGCGGWGCDPSCPTSPRPPAGRENNYDSVESIGRRSALRTPC